jgi:hypothetical protein
MRCSSPQTAGRSCPRLLLLLVCLLPAVPAAAQQAPPSPEAVLGYALGQHFTEYHRVREYSRALAAASPRVEYRVYGTTPGRRELIQLIIARPENLARLDQILAANEELTRPETPLARAREIAVANPAIVFFSYGVHGNESSSSEAAMWTAWDLAREAPEVAGVLDSLVVIIDPVANPDGRDRYVSWFNSVVGARPNPGAQSREHREPWPGGRFNHYLFDLNRDWAWATQPETRARLATWWRFNPQVHVDFHEMGYQSTYFFFPAAAPINPIYPPHVLEWGRRFGQANAQAFDARGWPYFTAESFDLFYPGYGDSWPSLTGAIGMTYEMAGHGMAGLAIERAVGDTLTLAQRATQHWVAGRATLRTAAAGKSRLLLDYAASQREVGRGDSDVLLVPGTDTTRIRALVEHLGRQGIVVERAERAFRVGTQAYPGFARRADFPAGTHLVRMRQPRGRLAATLLQPETELRAEYSYDISAWSLPYAYGVEAHQVSNAPRGVWQTAAVVGSQPIGQAPAASFGYLLPPGEASAAGIIRFLDGGGRARVMGRAATFAGQRWPAGTWFLPVAGNDTLQARVNAAGLGALAVPVRGALSEEGIDLGSGRVAPVRLPRVAVLAGDGIFPTSFGAYWFYLEQELGMRFDALLLGDLQRADLGLYDVIVIPDASTQLLGDAQREQLRGWVQRGGRLIAAGGAAASVAPIAEVESREGLAAEDDRARLLRGREERQRDDWRDEVPGSIIPARLDGAHPLAWGAAAPGDASRIFLLHTGQRIFEPAPNIETVVHFPPDLRPVSGVISDDNVARLEEGSWLVTRSMGRGSIVLFAGDPLFRLFWRATHPLFLNALLLGPGM